MSKHRFIIIVIIYNYQYTSVKSQITLIKVDNIDYTLYSKYYKMLHITFYLYKINLYKFIIFLSYFIRTIKFQYRISLINLVFTISKLKLKKKLILNSESKRKIFQQISIDLKMIYQQQRI